MMVNERHPCCHEYQVGAIRVVPSGRCGGTPFQEAFDQIPVFDPLTAAPEPALEFDQTVTG